MGARRYGIYLRVFNRYLTLSGKRNSISTSKHVLFCLSYKRNSSLPNRKFDFINESIIMMKNMIHNS